MADEDGKTKVTLLTANYRIKGYIDMIPGARVTDFLVDSKDFLALTDVEVWELGGRQVLVAPFVNVSRDQIEIVTPEAN